jgi:hypothetical protein
MSALTCTMLVPLQPLAQACASIYIFIVDMGASIPGAQEYLKLLRVLTVAAIGTCVVIGLGAFWLVRKARKEINVNEKERQARTRICDQRRRGPLAAEPLDNNVARLPKSQRRA